MVWVLLTKTLTSLSFFLVTFSVLEIRSIGEKKKKKTKNNFLSGCTNSELKIKHTDGEQWHQFALLPVKYEPGAPTGSQSPMLSWAASPWCTKDNFKVCVSSPLFFLGGEGMGSKAV